MKNDLLQQIQQIFGTTELDIVYLPESKSVVIVPKTVLDISNEKLELLEPIESELLMDGWLFDTSFLWMKEVVK